MTSHSNWQTLKPSIGIVSTRNWLARSSYFRIFLPSLASTILSQSNPTIGQKCAAAIFPTNCVHAMLANCMTTFVTFAEIALKLSCAKLQLLKGWALDAFLMTKMGNTWKSETQWRYQQGAATSVLPTTNHTWFEKIWAFSMALKTKVGCSMD